MCDDAFSFRLQGTFHDSYQTSVCPVTIFLPDLKRHKAKINVLELIFRGKVWQLSVKLTMFPSPSPVDILHPGWWSDSKIGTEIFHSLSFS